MGGLKRGSLDQSVHTHPLRNWCQSNRDMHTHAQMHTILETFISVAHNAPPLHTHTPPMMKLISKPVAHACMHTNTSKVPQAVYQSTFSQPFPSYKSFNFSTQKVFFFSFSCTSFWFPHTWFLHLHDGILVPRAAQRCSVPPHIML